ncbi:MAG: D-alanyl-D-alanine carboxypeptidase [Solirubrobacterales bacterium]|jgi:D-alanyl-D-alanine carboxypeptidase|nr:D-alanyl-D-alanine carboxypeptidase [Solirubrobacterales bacterium]
MDIPLWWRSRRHPLAKGHRPLGAIVVALALLAIGFADSGAAATGAGMPRPSVNRVTAKRLSAAITRELRRQALPGVIVGVAEDGRAPWIVARGHANLQTLRPMRPDLHMRIGSVTKAFVTTLLLRLAQEGQLSLDAPISRYVAGVPGGEAITLRQLANMTSGLADNFANPEFSLEYLTGETFTPERLVELGLALPTLFPPGSSWSYSNTNTILLGMVIQQVTGQPLAAALKQRVFAPLGLRGTSLPSFRPLPKPYASGYTYQTLNGRLGDATLNTPTATWAAGGIVSTVPDLLKAARMFGTGKPLLTPATQREREQWVRFAPNSPTQRYGIGVFDFDGWIGHNGGIPGYTAIAWYLPERHLSLVVSVNSDIHVGAILPNYAYEPASELAHFLTRILSPDHVAPAAVKVRGSRVKPVR